MLRDESGHALIGAMAFVSLAAAFLAILCDLGAAQVVRARLQTAADAGALAGVYAGTALKVRRELTPVVKTEFFSKGDKLPPEEYIKDKDPVYRRKDGKDELKGWNVTYIAGYEDRPVDWWLELNHDLCREEAYKVARLNMSAFPEGFAVYGPFLLADTVREEGDEVHYFIEELGAGMDRMFAGIFRDELFYLKAKSEAQASLHSR